MNKYQHLMKTNLLCDIYSLESDDDQQKTNDGQNHKSVTESAKTVLATVRQRRKDNKKEAYDRQSSLSYSNRELRSNNYTDNDKHNSALAQAESSLISSKSPASYTDSSAISARKYTGDNSKTRTATRQSHLSNRVEVPNGQYSVKQNRRCSSSLPLSSSFYGNPSSVGHQNEGASRSNKFQQVGKKHNYVAKKSALDKSKGKISVALSQVI
ncbi:unnamed protein product [Absidia cylindrospora]